MSELPNITPGPPPSDAVKGPAMFLMAVGGLILVGNAFGFLWSLLTSFGIVAHFGFFPFMNGIMGILQSCFSLIIGGVVAFGGFKMMKLQNYNLAMAAAVLALIPCSVCCLIGLPAGIWALIILMKPEVKAAFTQGGGLSL
jgi:hypothetical protein